MASATAATAPRPAAVAMAASGRATAAAPDTPTVAASTPLRTGGDQPASTPVLCAAMVAKAATMPMSWPHWARWVWGPW